MTFYTQGLTSHELMPVVRLFNKKTVERTHRTDSKHRIDSKEHYSDSSEQLVHSGIAMQSYHDIEQLPQSNSVMIASQIMSSAVIILKPHDTIADTIKLFKKTKLRHIPVVTSDERVVGILSDRDIFHYLSGVTGEYKQLKSPIRINDEIKRLISSRVLTASTDTDVRFIARLFVEQHIGAMPIVTDGNIVGIITRSDTLGAVMRNFILELWA